MKTAHTLLTLLLAAAIAFGVARTAITTSPTAQAQIKETAFARVMRTNTLRCGYVLMPPQLARDPNTSTFSGVAYDLMTEIGRRLELKIDWTEETTFMTVAEGLKNGRYDAFCLTAYRWLPSTRVMDYTTPVFWSTTNAYVRADDSRFDTDPSVINDPSVKIATLDGEASTFLRAELFPESTAVSLPISTDPSLVLESVATKKADVALSNTLMIMPYLLSHPGMIRRMATPSPIKAYSHAFGFAKGEQSLLSMIDVAIEDMIQDGTIDKILDKYESVPNSFVRVQKAVR